jgi:hypothetical protein
MQLQNKVLGEEGGRPKIWLFPRSNSGTSPIHCQGPVTWSLWSSNVISLDILWGYIRSAMNVCTGQRANFDELDVSLQLWLKMGYVFIKPRSDSSGYFVFYYSIAASQNALTLAASYHTNARRWRRPSGPNAYVRQPLPERPKMKLRWVLRKYIVTKEVDNTGSESYPMTGSGPVIQIYACRIL